MECRSGGLAPCNRLPPYNLQLHWVSCPLMADDVKAWIHHWQDEGDAAFLYDILAAQESDPKKRDIYDKLAGVERRHTEIRAKLLGGDGPTMAAAAPTPPPHTPASARPGRRLGPPSP